MTATTTTVKRTYFLAVEVDGDPAYSMLDFQVDAQALLGSRVQVYASPVDLVKSHGAGRYAEDSVDDPEWQRLCAQVQAALPGDPQELRGVQHYLEACVFGSWASPRRIKRFATNSFANVPGGVAHARYKGRPAIPTEPIASKDQLRLLLAALERRKT